MRTRSTAAEFKAKVALKAIHGQRTLRSWPRGASFTRSCSGNGSGRRSRSQRKACDNKGFEVQVNCDADNVLRRDIEDDVADFQPSRKRVAKSGHAPGRAAKSIATVPLGPIETSFTPPRSPPLRFEMSATSSPNRLHGARRKVEERLNRMTVRLVGDMPRLPSSGICTRGDEA
jgi:hypothetical protein